MKPIHFTLHDDYDDPQGADEPDDASSEEDLWFLPGPVETEPDDLPPGPRAEPPDAAQIAPWAQAEAAHAAQLARVAGRLGALDERLRRGPDGWRHRLALVEAAELSWHAGDRVSADRLALWVSLRLSGAQEDAAALGRTHWAVRRLTSGPGPLEDLPRFLARRDPEGVEAEAERFVDRADSWLAVMAQAGDLHPITRAALGYHLWRLAGLGQDGEPVEAAVTAARIAATEHAGAFFVPLAMGGAGALRATGSPSQRLSHWLDGLQAALLSAMRHLDEIEAWQARAAETMAALSGRTPRALRAVLTEWPVVSAPMAEALTGASRAAVQRNLAWMETHGLIREMTGQGRFRFWTANTR